VPASSETAAERRVVLPADVALHARPAGLFVRAAAGFRAAVWIEAGGRRADAKSILQVLGLGATGGTELAITASGDDAAEAVEGLAALVARLT